MTWPLLSLFFSLIQYLRLFSLPMPSTLSSFTFPTLRFPPASGPLHTSRSFLLNTFLTSSLGSHLFPPRHSTFNVLSLGMQFMTPGIRPQPLSLPRVNGN